MGHKPRPKPRPAHTLAAALPSRDAAAIGARLAENVVLRDWSTDGVDVVASRALVAERLASMAGDDPELLVHRTSAGGAVIELTARSGPPARRIDLDICLWTRATGGTVTAVDLYRAGPIPAAAAPVDIVSASLSDDALARVLASESAFDPRTVAVENQIVHRRADVIFSRSPQRDPLFNIVHAARFTEAEADARIDALCAFYREVGNGFTWRVSDLDTPRDLGARLLARGLVHEGDASVMALRLADAPRPTADADIDVAPLDGDDVEQRDIALDITARAFGWSAAKRAEIRAWWPSRLRTTGIAHRRLHVLARVAGQPAGFASLSLHRGLAQLTGAAVLPALQRRGVYTALLARRLADARAAGYEVATITAMETSRDIVARLGFTEHIRLSRYVWRPEDLRTPATSRGR